MALQPGMQALPPPWPDPSRPEQMERDTIDAVIRVVERWTIPCVDLTGGAPELNPDYEYLVERLRPDRGPISSPGAT